MNKEIPQHLAIKINNYKTPESVKEAIRSAQIVFLVGVAGAGKDTIMGRLIETGNYHPMVSYTSRQPRANDGVMEQNGIDYHFVDFTEIDRMIDDEEFIEVKMTHGNIYGSGVSEINTAKSNSKIALNEIDVKGIAEYKLISDKVLPIFLLPPNYKVWQERLAKRYGNSVDESELNKRLITARDELQEALKKDYYEFVINDDLEGTINTVDKIAHGHISSDKNDEAKVIAQDILNELNSIL